MVHRTVKRVRDQEEERPRRVIRSYSCAGDLWALRIPPQRNSHWVSQ